LTQGGLMAVYYKKSYREARKTRAAAYCRVSTNLDNQEDSFETQRRYYDEYIHSNPEWEFAGIYSDQGISGTDAKKRPGFQQMVTDAIDGKIDLILVKSISRFSRNLIDCRNYAEKLHSYGVEIRFEKEGISTNDPTAFLMFGLMATIAQSESESISQNMKWRFQKNFEQGKYSLGNRRFLGYGTTRDGKTYITEDAWIIRKIYRMFLDGYCYRAIAEAVNEAGGHSVTGKPMTIGTVQNILRNETYVGDKLLQKYAPANFLTHRPDTDADYDSYYVTNGHPAIIDRDTWNAVQKKLDDQRDNGWPARDSAKGCKVHFLTNMVFCGNCGTCYRRRKRGRKNHYWTWVCKDRDLGRSGNGCKNRIIREDDLLKAICEELGWEWRGAEAFDQAEFKKKIDHIVVYDDRFEIVKKP
jgi:site-specific DNA recombinase